MSSGGTPQPDLPTRHDAVESVDDGFHHLGFTIDADRHLETFGSGNMLAIILGGAINIARSL